MTTIEMTRAEVVRLHEERTRLEQARDAVERERNERLRELQELCPHEDAVELKGTVKYPGEKSLLVEMRVCKTCNYTEHAPRYARLAAPRALERAKYDARSKYEVLGCTL